MPLEGIQLSHYRLLKLIGRGAMGEVYLAEDISIKRQVAIKVIRADVSPYPTASAIQQATKLFRREVEAIANLHHPHILELYDYGEQTVNGVRYTYMVMPYCSDGSFATWLGQQHGLLSPQRVNGFMLQAADALQYAHDHQVIHRDVKPSNFLVRSKKDFPAYPDLLLADFGLAKSTAATATVSHNVVGTPTYMAPEQWNGQPVPATDQYALAVMAYELLTGRPPFQGSPDQVMYQHLNVSPQAPTALNRHIPSALDAVILRALAKNPRDRYPSITDFARAFQRVVIPAASMSGVSSSIRAGVSLRSTGSTGSPRVTPTISRFKATVLLYLLVTVLLGVVAGAILNGFGKLPSAVVIVAGSIGGVIALLSILLGGAFIERAFLKRLWQQAVRPLSLFASLLTIGLLCVPFIVEPIPSSPLSLCQAAGSCSTPVQPTATMPPQPGVTPTVPRPTSTPNPTPKTLPTPSFSQQNNQYFPNMSQQVMSDPMSNQDGYYWDVVSQSYGTCSFKGGAYHINAPAQQGIECNTNSSLSSFIDFTYQISMTIDSGSDAFAGIAFRINTKSVSFYEFGCDVNGDCAYETIVSKAHQQPHTCYVGTDFNTGFHQTNLIAVVAQSTTLVFYINGKEECPITDSYIVSPGQIGVFFSTGAEPGEAEFSQANVWT